MRSSALIAVLIFLLRPYSFCSPEDSASACSKINKTRLAVVIGGVAGLITFAHLQNYNSWWKGVRGPFHRSTGPDDTYSLGADKCGHFLFSYYAADAAGRALGWSGVDEADAFAYGGAIALTFQLYVEVEDGFHPALGFSLGDAAADLLGSAFPLVRSHEKFLNCVFPKWSAYPSALYKLHQYRTIIDDYESQYYWLSVNIADAVGGGCPAWAPSFLNVAFGYGVTNLDMVKSGTRELYVALDCDFDKLPGDGTFLAAVKHALNYVHCPAPVLKLTPRVTLYGIRF